MPNNPMPAGFDQTLTNYLIATAGVADFILTAGAAREPEKYAKAADLVKSGRLIPQVALQPGLLILSLIDTQTGKSVGDIFQYSSPALEARGVPN